MIALVLTACDGGRKTIKLFEQIVELYNEYYFKTFK